VRLPSGTDTHSNTRSCQAFPQRGYWESCHFCHIVERSAAQSPRPSVIEKPVAPAAAQLDKIRCANFWTRTVLAESPSATGFSKHALIDGRGDCAAELRACREIAGFSRQAIDQQDFAEFRDRFGSRDAVGAGVLTLKNNSRFRGNTPPPTAYVSELLES
jgi:hypothetical protein